MRAKLNEISRDMARAGPAAAPPPAPLLRVQGHRTGRVEAPLAPLIFFRGGRRISLGGAEAAAGCELNAFLTASPRLWLRRVRGPRGRRREI